MASPASSSAAAALLSGLLPKTAADFRDVSYWRGFFEKRRGRAFEWYGEYPHFRRNLAAALPDRGARILVLGCGNSEMSAQMYADGYTRVVNVDFDAGVIEEMRRKTAGACPGMEWLVQDATALDLPAASFDAVLDKGTLDAMCTDDSEAVVTSVRRMVSEAARVLRPGGLYAVVTLGQDHLLATWAGGLLAAGNGSGGAGGGGGAWASLDVRPFADGGVASSPMCPLFVAVTRTRGGSSEAAADNTLPATVHVPSSFDKQASAASGKQAPLPPAEATHVTLTGGAGVTDAAAVAPLVAAVGGIRWGYRMARTLGAIASGNYLQLDLWAPAAAAAPAAPSKGGAAGGAKKKGTAGDSSASASSSSAAVIVSPPGVAPPGVTPGAASEYGPGPRFCVTVVDVASSPRAGVLLVPQGREHEWSFGTEEGQRELAAAAALQHGGLGRLLFVAMGRGHAFSSSPADVQRELAPLVLRLLPPTVARAADGAPAGSPASIPYIAVQEDTGTRWHVHAGSSALSGAFVVEDVPDDGSDDGGDEGSAAAGASAEAAGDADSDDSDALPSLGGGKARAAKSKSGKKKGGSGSSGKKKGAAPTTAAGAAAPTVPLRVLRRLVFMANRNAVQTEMRLTLRVPAGGKAPTPPQKDVPHDGLPFTVDASYLPFAFHRAMAGTMAALLQQVVSQRTAAAAPPGLNVLVIGLGGGSLPLFLASHVAALQRALNAGAGAGGSSGSVTAVELDPAVVDVARRYFGVGGNAEPEVAPESVPSASDAAASSGSSKRSYAAVLTRPPTGDAAAAAPAPAAAGAPSPSAEHAAAGGTVPCTVVVGDGLEYVAALAGAAPDAAALPDVLVVDVDSKDVSGGLTFPPPAFVAPPFLAAARSALAARSGGVLLLNVASRTPAAFAGVAAALAAAFPQSDGCRLYRVPVDDDSVNEVVAVTVPPPGAGAAPATAVADAQLALTESLGAASGDAAAPSSRLAALVTEWAPKAAPLLQQAPAEAPHDGGR